MIISPENKKEPVLLFRYDLSSEEEFHVANKYFKVYTQRSLIPYDSMVIGRYSVLPYYKELEYDLNISNSFLINNYKQHNLLYDIENWYFYLNEFTPKTWFNVEEIPTNENGPFIIKGRTNSRKHNWNTKMFCKDREHLGEVIINLLNDSLILDQGICIRKYVPLKTILTGINDLPITYEFRIFILNNKIINTGFYWSSYEYEVKQILGNLPNLISYSNTNNPFNFIYSVIDTLKQCKYEPPFYVMDIALTENSEWILIELNDAQMSGLSTISSDNFYKTLSNSFNPGGKLLV